MFNIKQHILCLIIKMKKNNNNIYIYYFIFRFIYFIYFLKFCQLIVLFNKKLYFRYIFILYQLHIINYI